MTHDNKTEAALDALDWLEKVSGHPLLNDRLSDRFETIRHALTEATELKAQNEELLGALKEIENCCGTVNFSSHNQMREAVEGSAEISGTAIARAKKGTDHD